jgi:hypothetical protein
MPRIPDSGNIRDPAAHRLGGAAGGALTYCCTTAVSPVGASGSWDDDAYW